LSGEEDRNEEFAERLSRVLSYGEREALLRELGEDMRKRREKLLEDLSKIDLSGPPRSQSGPPRGRFRPIEDDFAELQAQKRMAGEPQISKGKKQEPKK
jgi:hypothetical protein